MAFSSPIILIAVCLLCLAFFQMNETAFLYSFQYRKKAKEQSSYLRNIISKLYSIDGTYILSLRWVSLALLAWGVYTGAALIHSQTSSANAIVSISLYILLVGVFFSLGFLLPRIYGAKNADRILLRSAFLINIINSITIPITKILLLLPRLIFRCLKMKWDEDTILELTGTRGITREEISSTPQLKTSHIQENDMKIFRNALEFSNAHIKDSIVPRTEIIGLDINSTLQELLDCFIASGKTRIIIYNEDIDHIVGYVHSSDMFSSPLPEDWKELITDIPIVPESMSAQKLMQLFLKQKKSLALVADEFGGTSGIISLEDLVEEIFGDIEDEHDTINYIARKLSDNEYLLSARLEIEKVNELFGLDLPVSDEYITIGGLILYHYENFPKENQVIHIGKYEFYIQKTSKTQIHVVKLKVETSEEK